MNFLAPMMLAGLAALSVPVLLHLMNRVRVRTTDWGAMRFLQKSIKRQRSRVRIQDILLLIVRCLLVVLVVLAFARLVSQSPVLSHEDSSGPVAAVVILDHSASMGAFEGSLTRFDLAKQASMKWLDEQTQGSMVALHLVSNRTQSVMAQPSPHLSMIRGMLAKAELSARGSNLVEGIRLACQTLREQQVDLPREVHVFSDGQSHAWSKEQELKNVIKSFPEVRIVPYWVGTKGLSNVAVTELKVEGGMPAEGQVCRLMAEVTNFSSSSIRDLQVTLAWNGKESVASGSILEIAAGGSQALALMVQMPQAGLHELVAKLSGTDALISDNQRSMVVEVAARTEVLLVEEDHAGPAMDREGYFLANALVPMERDRAAAYYLGVQFISPASIADELTQENVQAPQAVILCNLGALSQTAITALHDYVKKGGHLLVFPGERTTIESWETMKTWEEMMPASWNEVVQPAQALAWKGAGLTHPVTALWNDETQGSLSAVRFHKFLALQVKKGANVVSELEDGTASVVEWSVGEGNVVLFGSTATPDWNNLPLHPAFVPYLQRLMGYLKNKGENRFELSPGQVYRLSLPDQWLGKRMRVRTPDGNEWGIPGAIQSEATSRIERESWTEGVDDGKLVLRFGETEKLGGYRLLGDDEKEEVVGMFAVQMDPEESDLSQMELERVQSWLERSPDDLAMLAANDESMAMAMAVKKEFWTWLMWMALTLYVIEGVLSFWFSRRETRLSS